jgi:Ni,Fe-hydrogenase I small subunit
VRVTVAVPADAYELNFIFSDGEGTYDNNDTRNYVLAVEGPMSRELWADTAPERAVSSSRNAAASIAIGLCAQSVCGVALPRCPPPYC